MSAIKASLVLYDLPHDLLDHPRLKLFLKSVRINRPLTLVPHNIIDLDMLEKISLAVRLWNFQKFLELSS